MLKALLFLLPVLSLASALAVHLLSPSLHRQVARLSVVASVATLAVASVLLWLALAGEQSTLVKLGPRWGSLLFDPLSVLMGFVVAAISLVVHLYSVRYMVEESGYGRYFVLLDLMTAALLAMVTAGDLITLLVAWHLIGVLLYFLLGQNHRSVSAYRYGFWSFFTYRIGDLPLVVAAALLFNAYGTWSLPELFEHIASDAGTPVVLGLSLSEAVAALIGLAAFARSAQFFLHTWLPYTMEGPTPVSALMHAGIVNAGGVLINRFAPVFVNSGDVLNWIFVVGLVTAVAGSILMLTQNDIKKSLGYSTMGQMGFMIMECGVGAFSLAIYHLIAHALFKGTLFLNAGGVISAARIDDGIPKEELYTFIVERRPAVRRQPWVLMAAITLVVPVTILGLAHWLVAQDFFQKQGAIVLLFFGWVTGAQLLFSTYRMRSQNPWRLVALIVFSFTVVVIGYTLISHAFDLFLYPDRAFRSAIYAAAGIDLLRFDVLVGALTILIVLGWVVTFYSEQSGRRRPRQARRAWKYFYALVSREFYLIDLYAWLKRVLLSAAARLNVWLRWV